MRKVLENWNNNKHCPADFHSPVEQPGLFGAGQSIHEFISLWGDGGFFVHGPGKVPLLHSSCCDGAAVHGGLQVGTYPGTRHEDELEATRAVKLGHKDKQDIFLCDVFTFININSFYPLVPLLKKVSVLVVVGVGHPLFEPAGGQLLTAAHSGAAGQRDSIHLIVPGWRHERTWESEGGSRGIR